MSRTKKVISIVSGAYNEEKNIREFYNRIRKVMEQHQDDYDYEIIIAENCSADRTRDILRELAAEDKRLRCIFNSRNFGVVRSTFNGILHATGDALVTICSDLQEPPEVISEMIKSWEAGFDVVCAVKKYDREKWLMRTVRKSFYRLLSGCTDDPLINDYSGFGLYDKKVMDALHKFDVAYPYFRGMVSEIGFKVARIPYVQEERRYGKSSYNVLSYYDYAMTGFVHHSRLPLRMAVFSGFFIAVLSIFVAIGYFIYKCCNWNSFQVGMAPLVIGLFFFSAIQLIFVGILGEYIGAIWLQVKKCPLVVEEEKINFPSDDNPEEE